MKYLFAVYEHQLRADSLEYGTDAQSVGSTEVFNGNRSIRREFIQKCRPGVPRVLRVNGRFDSVHDVSAIQPPAQDPEVSVKPVAADQEFDLLIVMPRDPEQVFLTLDLLQGPNHILIGAEYQNAETVQLARRSPSLSGLFVFINAITFSLGCFSCFIISPFSSEFLRKMAGSRSCLPWG